MRKLISLLLVFSLFFLSGNMFAEARRKAEICYAGGLYFGRNSYNSFLGTVSLGYYFKLIGAEVNGIVVFKGITIFGSNLSLGLFDNQRLIPYATGGIWKNSHEGYGYNVGGGIKIRFEDGFAIRAEYRHYFYTEEGDDIDMIIGGLSLFF